ncbi:MAG: peptidylprolyl isomerase [Candidatus Micrarchaeaceae archaeon]
MIQRIKQLVPKRKPAAPDVSGVSDTLRITNETVAARRDEVLASARKYIYPLQASKRRIVRLSVGVFIAAVIGFFGFCTLELYKFQSTSSFMYGVTRVLPFPVAVINNRYLVSYNSYLFELRRYMHYYQTQQRADFSTAAGRQQLTVLKQRSMDETMQYAYVQRLAATNHLSVSSNNIDSAVALVRSQNRLGSSDQVFANVLNEFWGWSVDDFRRELGQELLAQKVVDRLDVGTHSRANQALAQLQHGVPFGDVAKSMSDDVTTRGNGGDYGTAISKSNTDIAPQVVAELFQLKQGQYSGIINTGYSLEIIEVTSVQDNTVHASHIAFNFQPVVTYTTPLQKSQKPHMFIHE